MIYTIDEIMDDLSVEEGEPSQNEVVNVENEGKNVDLKYVLYA